MLLGLGMNGHLGLNEPGGSFEDYAKVVELSETPMQVGQKYFSGPTKLTRGITLGVHHMYEAKTAAMCEASISVIYNLLCHIPPKKGSI